MFSYVVSKQYVSLTMEQFSLPSNMINGSVGNNVGDNDVGGNVGGADLVDASGDNVRVGNGVMLGEVVGGVGFVNIMSESSGGLSSSWATLLLQQKSKIEKIMLTHVFDALLILADMILLHKDLIVVIYLVDADLHYRYGSLAVM